MSHRQHCDICGKPLSNDPLAVHHYDPNVGGGDSYFCGEHNPNPPTESQLSDRERQEVEAGMAAFRVEVESLYALINDLERPVSPVDRSNIALELLRLFDRTLWLMNEVRELKGQDRLPPRLDW